MLDALQAVAGLVVLYFGGEWLVRGASLMAQRLGMPPLIIGVTIVAAGTSMPELVVSVHAATIGVNDLSLGNVVGSNICNIALILGVASSLRPIDASAPMVRVHTPVMIAVTLLLMAMMTDGVLGVVDGVVLLAGIVAYTLHTLREARQTPASECRDQADPAPGRGMVFALLLVGSGLALLLAGAHLLIEAAVSLATAAGVSEAFIGLTIVAVGTSLPELTTSVVASIRRQGDLAVGNIVGSNIFNILGILGITAVLEPLAMGGITWTDHFVMLAVACLLLVLLRSGRRLGRGSGVLFLSSYLGYMTWLAGSA